MPRWKPDGSERLMQAALELFAEQGYDATTVGQISERAGLTQRTFYNHYPDKREVLFGLSHLFQTEAIAAFRTAGTALSPLEALVRALQAVCESMFQDQQSSVARRLSVIRANPELRERELAKQAALAAALDETLVESGLDSDTAALTVGAALLVQQTAVDLWIRPGKSLSLHECFTSTLQALRTAVAPALS